MSPLRVLIVDDDPEVSSLIRLRLSREAPHLSIATVDSGRECLEYLKENRVDCILSDFQMPVMDGMDLLKRLNRLGCEIPFIFLTGQGNEEVAREAFKNGAYDYFTKEIGFAHFTRIINSIEQAVRHKAAELSKARAEDALIEEKNKLEAVLESIGDGISILGTDYKILYQNEAHMKMGGEHVGDLCYMAYYNQEKVCESCSIAESFKDGKIHTVERSLPTEAGTKHFEVTTSPLRDASGGIIAGIEVLRDVTHRKKVEVRLARFSECLISFGADPLANINSLTALCGELLGSACALYNRLDKEILCSWGMWNAPPGYNPADRPEGHLCYDVIRLGGDGPMLVRNLPETPYARTDPNVLKYGLKTYIGQAVKFGGVPVGSLCAVFQRDFVPDGEDIRLMGIIASAIGVEETRKAAEDALRESESRFRSLVEESLVGVYIVQDGGFVYVNPRHAEIFGYTQEENLRVKDIYEMVAPYDRGFVRENIRKRVSGEVKSIHYEFHGQRKDKGIINVEVYGSQTVYNGRPAVIGTLLDITERKRAEDGLRESERRYREMIENIHLAAVRLDEEGRVAFINDFLLHMTGWRRGQVLGKDWFNIFIPAEERDKVKAYFLEIIREGNVPPHNENYIQTRQGERRLFYWSNTVHRDGAGKVIGTNSIGEDVTERRKAVEALRESEYSYRTLSENLPGIVYRVFLREGNRMQFFNSAILPMTGYSTDELGRGEVCYIEKLILPEDLPKVVETVKRAIDEDNPYQVEYRLKRKDGVVRHFLERGRPVRGPDGMPLYIDGVIFDITGQKEAEEERSAVFHMLTHDIKSPLTLIYGYAEILAQQLTGRAASETVDEIKKAARRISVMIDDMLTLARVETGRRAAIKPEPVSLPDILRQAVQDNLLSAYDIDVTIDMEVEEGFPEVNVDRALITRAFGNLVANAVKYNRHGGRVLVRAGRTAGDPDQVFVEVSDTGIGIAGEDLPHLFEKYYRGKKAGHRSGTGLGLAVVKAAVEAHGGSVSVTSSVMEGSRFLVVLPVNTAVSG